MDLTQSTYCTMLSKTDNVKYLCYFHMKAGVFNIGVSDAVHIWTTGYTEDTLATDMKKFALKSTEGYISKIRAACNKGNASFQPGEDSAHLHLGDAEGSMSLSLTRLSESQSRDEMRDLLFRMAESLTHLQDTASMSPVKNQHRVSTEFEPRKQQNGPVLAIRKRTPGESLINPGIRRKKPAAGVAFDDTDDP